jgi:multiple sugar transport system permease protein
MKRTNKKNIVQRLTPAFFVGPHLVFFIIFFAVPFLYGIYISLTKWDMMSDPVWNGSNNFQTILTDVDNIYSRSFFNGLKNTFFFVLLTVPPIIIFPLGLALLLNTIKKGSRLFQIIFYAPSLLSVATTGIAWRWIFDRDFGMINNIFSMEANWLGSQPYAWFGILILCVWAGMGGNMVIFLAGLSSVPQTYYEAADIDGANSWAKFFKITLPELKFPLLYSIVMGTIGAFNVFGQPYMLTGGGPNESTSVLMMYIQQYAFGRTTPVAGMASAMALLLGIVIAAVSAIQFRMLRNKEER